MHVTSAMVKQRESINAESRNLRSKAFLKLAWVATILIFWNFKPLFVIPVSKYPAFYEPEITEEVDPESMKIRAFTYDCIRHGTCRYFKLINFYSRRNFLVIMTSPLQFSIC